MPGREKLDPSAWDVESSHFAERFQLFIIIALGESIVVTGATTSQLSLGVARLTAFGLAFLITAAFWWLYFSYVANIAQRRLELASDRTTVARNGYTYLHVVLVAGIIVSAVGDELVIQHPTETLTTAQLVAVVAGPVIYLARPRPLPAGDGGHAEQASARWRDRVRADRRRRRSSLRRSSSRR